MATRGGFEELQHGALAESSGAERAPGLVSAKCSGSLEPSPTGRGAKGACFMTEGRTFGELAEVLLTIFIRLEVSLGLRCSKIKSSGGIFPLPETRQGVLAMLGQDSPFDSGVLVGICRALNSYAGAGRVGDGQRTKAALAALRTLSGYAITSGLSCEKFDGVQWEQFMAVRSVDYRGEEVKVAKKFSWANIEPALPDAVGTIPLVDVCEGGVLDFVNNFERYLLPSESRVYTKPPRIFVEPESWEQVCSGLISKGVCRLIPLSEVYHFSEGPLLNGLFSVSKEEFTATGVEICRLIMNLVPTNKLCRNLGGDLSTLPSVTGLSSIVLGKDDVLVMSSEDIKCFFYLFSVPSSWHKFMAFGREVPPSVAPQGAREPYYMAARVLPMGFISSVAIAQHVHRRIARMYLHGVKPTHGGQCELRRDRPGTCSSWMYRIYLDNFDALEKCDRKLAGLIKGEPSAEALAIRQGYLELGLPRHPKKSVQQEVKAEVQGALVNGVTGKVEPKVQKVLKYVELAWSLLKEGKTSQKQMQVVCGGFVYCCMFRRPLLGMLNQVWQFIMSFENEPPVVRKPIPLLVQYELLRFMLSIPLAQMNLRTPARGDVTCSDASEWGGGFCISKGLTRMGVHAAGCQVRGDLPDIEDHVQVLTIGLFDGVGALRVGADLLKLPMAGHVSSEVSREGSRVLESNFPDTLQVGDVTQIDSEMVLSWSARYSNVGVVVVGGGPPCQGVSGLNADRKGALKDARSNLFVHVKRVYKLCRQHFRWAQVHYLMESVFSMDADDRATMSEHMESTPWLVDAADVAICRRPRLYWISWEIRASPVVSVTAHGHGWELYHEVKLAYTVDPASFLLTGWSLEAGNLLPTFTTSRPRSSPGNRPAGLWQCQPWEVGRWTADSHRYPPYVYRDKHMLVNRQGDRRLPSIAEKEAAMGFPVGYTEACVAKGLQKGDSYLDIRHTLIGNSWHVPTIAWLLSQLFQPLGLTPLGSLEEIMEAAKPGTERRLQGFLRRPPLNRIAKQPEEVPETELTKRLLQFVSVKGEDLLLQADSENTIRFHRLRASVPSKLWNWRTVCGWPWKRGGYHINALEMQAVLTCLEWRIARKRQHCCRLLHLTDSLVTVACPHKREVKFPETPSSAIQDQCVAPCVRRLPRMGLRRDKAKSCRSAVEAAGEEVMGKAKQVVEGRTREQRIEQRKALGSLKSLAVQPATKKRYEAALNRFFDFLRFEGISLPKQKQALDDLVSEYVEHLWSSGEGRALASDTLAGLQNLEPHLKRLFGGLLETVESLESK